MAAIFFNRPETCMLAHGLTNRFVQIVASLHAKRFKPHQNLKINQ